MPLAAIAAGTDGLLIEVHPNPDEALKDGAQSLNAEAPSGSDCHWTRSRDRVET